MTYPPKQDDLCALLEPVKKVAYKAGRRIMEIIRDLAEESGKTVILVTHEPNIAAFAHKTVRLKDGVILESP